MNHVFFCGCNLFQKNQQIQAWLQSIDGNGKNVRKKPEEILRSEQIIGLRSTTAGSRSRSMSRSRSRSRPGLDQNKKVGELGHSETKQDPTVDKERYGSQEWEDDVSNRFTVGTSDNTNSRNYILQNDVSGITAACLFENIASFHDTIHLEHMEITWSRISVTVSKEMKVEERQGKEYYTLVYGFANIQQKASWEPLHLTLAGCKVKASNHSSIILQHQDHLLLLREHSDHPEKLNILIPNAHCHQTQKTENVGCISGTATKFVLAYDEISVGTLSTCSSLYKSDQSAEQSQGAKLFLTGLDSGLNIKRVSCGYEHSVFLTQHGSVLTVGSGSSKWCVAAGTNHVATSCLSGNSNPKEKGPEGSSRSRGQLGHGSIENELLPQAVSALEGVQCVCIAAGGWHSAVVTECGDLYLWGWNETGQMGLPSPSIQRLRHHQHREGQSPQAASLHLWPQLVQVGGGADIVVSQVACGTRHTALVTEMGKAFTTGWNKYGQLGLGHTDSVDKFTPVLFPAGSHCSVTQVFCGDWNSVFVVRELSAT